MDVERRAALTEKLSQEAEILRLKLQLNNAIKNQKTETFPIGVPGKPSPSGVRKSKEWKSSIGGLLYLMWNGVSLDEETSKVHHKKKKESDVICV